MVKTALHSEMQNVKNSTTFRDANVENCLQGWNEETHGEPKNEDELSDNRKLKVQKQ